MKKKLFLLLCALLTCVGMWADGTDVTSTYITNPGFEGTSNRFFDINTDRGVEKPVGWSVEWYQNNNDKNGMTYDAVSMTQDGKTWNAKSGKSYFARMRWGNATLYLRQTLQNLRPGSYTLSFSATAHSAGASNKVQVSVANQTQTIANGVVDNADGNWTDYNINFTVTASTPYATIEFKADRAGDLLKIGIDEFSLTYDGSSYYSTILTTAQALYDDNKDWAENGLSDFATAITTNSGKESVADKNAAIVALETAIATYKAANSTDMTSKINNPNFDSNISGWTCTGGDGNAFQRQTSTQRNFTGGFLEKWRNGWNGGYNQKNFDVNQTIASLPNGEYTIKAYIIAQMQGSKETLGDSYKDKKHGGPYYIDDNKGVWFYATSGSNSANTWANSFTDTFGDDGGGYLRSATVNVSNGSLTIGFKGIGSPNGGTELGTYANWIACDTWTLSYFGFDPTTLLAEITSLKAEAAALLSNDEYDNVVGTERTALTTASTLVPADEKKSTLEAAITQIEEAISAFTAAKTNYDQYAEAAAVAAAIGATSVTAPTTSAEALTRSHQLYANIDTKVTATYTYDATAIYSGSFEGSFTSTTTSQHWSGDGSKAYYDNYGSGNISATQTVTLPAGSYVIKVAGRGSADAVDHKVYMSANGTTVTFANNGDTGRGITKTGLVKYDAADDTYCNSNNGRGWEWRFIPLTLADETDVTVTVSFDRSGSTWGSFCDFTILLNSAEDADDDDYAALNDAISTAEAKTLGFEDGEFAPYNNVKALTTLALAKDINQEVSNPKSAINSITATLISSWTANDGEVNAFSNNGYFQSNINAIGWKNTNWIQQEGNYLCVPSGSSITYGETAAYTIPLKADTYYVLTFRHASWDTSNKDNGGSVSVLLNEDGLAATDYAGNPDYYKGDDTNYKKESFVFQTGAAGNYVLTLTGGSGRTTVKDFVLKEAESATMQISATAKMGTFCAPFDVSIPSSVTAYTLSAGASANWVHMTEVTGGTIEAGTPVLVAAPEIGETLTQTFHGNYTADPKNTGVLRGVYEKTDLTAGVDYLLQYQGGVCAFYKVTNTGFRVGKNRCYLHIDGGGSARIALGEEDDPTTAINEVEAIKAEAKTMKDGKYLVKGRIVIVNNGKAFGANGQILK